MEPRRQRSYRYRVKNADTTNKMSVQSLQLLAPIPILRVFLALFVAPLVVLLTLLLVSLVVFFLIESNCRFQVEELHDGSEVRLGRLSRSAFGRQSTHRTEVEVDFFALQPHVRHLVEADEPFLPIREGKPDGSRRHVETPLCARTIGDRPLFLGSPLSPSNSAADIADLALSPALAQLNQTDNDVVFVPFLQSPPVFRLEPVKIGKGVVKGLSTLAFGPRLSRHSSIIKTGDQFLRG